MGKLWINKDSCESIEEERCSYKSKPLNAKEIKDWILTKW